jgi:integrase
VVSLGYAADGKRIRKKVSGQTRTEVKDKLKALHSELDAGVRTVQGYTVEAAVADWLAEGLPGRAAKTVEVYRDALRPVLAVVGRISLRDLTVQDVRTALAKMAVTHSTPTLQKAHNCLTRALRHAEGRDLVRRNVSALVDTPHGREGRPSHALTVEQAAALLEAAEDSRLHAYIVLCLLTGVRSEEARALTWDHVDLDARTISVWRSVRAHGDTKTNRSRRTLGSRRSSSKRCRASCGARPRSARRRGSCGKSTAWCSPPPWARRMSPTTCAATSARSPRRPGWAPTGSRRNCAPRSSA